MDGTLGSRTAWMLDGSGVRHHERRGARGDRPRRRRGGLAGRRARDRRPREPRGARRVRADARRLGAARAAPADRARTVPRAGGHAALRASSASPSRPVHARAVGPRPRGALLGRTAWTARTPSARCSTPARVVANGSDAPIEELDPWAGVVAGVLRTPTSGPLAAGAGAHRSSRRCTRPASRPAWLSHDERDARDADPRPRSQIWSCSTAIRSRASPAELPEVQVVATMLGGRWVHNPPPWD